MDQGMRDAPQPFSVEAELESLSRRNRGLEQKLAQHTRILDRRVQERTAQLSDLVEALRAEIAGRKRTEEELRRSEEQYHMLAANFPNGALMMLDRDLRYVLAEGAGLEAVGISKEFLVGKRSGSRFRRKLRQLSSRIIAPLFPARHHFRSALLGAHLPRTCSSPASPRRKVAGSRTQCRRTCPTVS
jgi:PAS domain-containing protein